jgi:hypothetical protein
LAYVPEKPITSRGNRMPAKGGSNPNALQSCALLPKRGCAPRKMRRVDGDVVLDGKATSGG